MKSTLPPLIEIIIMSDNAVLYYDADWSSSDVMRKRVAKLLQGYSAALGCFVKDTMSGVVWYILRHKVTREWTEWRTRKMSHVHKSWLAYFNQIIVQDKRRPINGHKKNMWNMMNKTCRI